MREKGRTREQVGIVRRRTIPGTDKVGVRGEIFARLINGKTGEVRDIPGHNLITSAGDVHYAERATTKTPSNTFNLLHLSTEAATSDHQLKGTVYGDIASFISGSSAEPTAGYPAQGDTDGDNSGSGNSVVSWRFSYSKASFASGVVQGVITTTGPTSGSPLLTNFVFASTFAKTSDDTLVIFVNHTFLGSS